MKKDMCWTLCTQLLWPEERKAFNIASCIVRILCSVYFFLDNRPLVCFKAGNLQGIIKAWAEEKWHESMHQATGFGFITFMHRSARCLGGRKGNLKP